MRYHKVSKLKDPELYFLILLQLYLPWRNENDLKGDASTGYFSTYQQMYDSVALDIKQNILKHDPYFEQIDLDLDNMFDYVAEMILMMKDNKATVTSIF